MMIWTAIFETYRTVWTDHPVSRSWSGTVRASARRSEYFNVAESWEGGFLYGGDIIVGIPKKP